MSRIRLGPAFCIAVAAAALFAAPAEAQTVAAVDSIVTAFRDQTSVWQGALRTISLEVFGILAAIQFFASMLRVAMRHGDMEAFIAEVVNQVLFLGFFAMLMTNSFTWGTAIFQGWSYAAHRAGGVGITPGEVIAQGINMADGIMTGAVFYHPTDALGFAIAALVVGGLFAWMAGEMVVVVVKTYYWLYAGTVMYGFGASVWTKDIAVSMFRHLFALGFELFTLQMLLALCLGLIQSWMQTAPAAVTWTFIFTEISCSVVVAVLVWRIPHEAQRIVNGSAVGNGPGLMAEASKLIGRMAEAAAVLTGAGVALAAAAELATEQAQAQAAAASGGGQGAGNGGQAPERSRLALPADIMTGTVGNLAEAATADIGRRLSGQGGGRGFMPWRMAADMHNQARLVRGDAERPSPTGGGGASGGGRGSLSAGNGGTAYQPWMSMSGGFDALTPTHQASAQASYDRWSTDNPELGKRHDLHDYVGYVQGKQAEREGRKTP